MKRTLMKLVTRILSVKVPLPLSIQYNRIEDIKIAVNLKVDVNYHELYNDAYVYPLLTAVYFGRYDICHLLLNKGCADPNFVYRNPKWKSKVGRTELRKEDRTTSGSEGISSNLLNVFSDPLLRISNQKNPPRLSIDLTGWKKITPTVLAFILGNCNLLEILIKKGGRLVENFDHENVSFVWYFLEHPTTCQSRICRLLVNYREYLISKSEQNAFQEFCEKFQVMKKKIIMSVDLTEDIEKIILMLQNYGFRKRESKKPKISPNSSVLNGMPVYSEYITEDEEDEVSLLVEESSSSCCCCTSSSSQSCDESKDDEVEVEIEVEEEEEEQQQQEEEEKKRRKMKHRRRSFSNPVHLDITLLTTNDSDSYNPYSDDSESCCCSDSSCCDGKKKKKRMKGKVNNTATTISIPPLKRRMIHQKSGRSSTLDPSIRLEIGMGRPSSNPCFSDSEDSNDFFISRTKELWIHHKYNSATSATTGTSGSSNDSFRRKKKVDDHCMKNDTSDTIFSSSSSDSQRKRILLSSRRRRRDEQQLFQQQQHESSSSSNKNNNNDSNNRRISESYENLKKVLEGSMTPFRFRRPKSSFRKGKKDLLKADESLVRNSINYRRKRRESNKFQQRKSNQYRNNIRNHLLVMKKNEGDRY